MKFAAPTAFMAQKKNIVDEAYPGDIVGIPDNGNFKIGGYAYGRGDNTLQRVAQLFA